MAQTTPPTITPPPPAPQRGNRNTFSSLLDAFLLWLVNSVAQFAAVAANVYNNAVDASGSATSANTSATTANSAANAALSAAGAVRWVSGTTYQLDQCVISPADSGTYRRRTAAAVSTVDPAQDPTNWTPPVFGGFTRVMVVTSSQSFTVPASRFKVKLQAAGGGGGSGGVRGGGAGGYVEKFFSGATIGATAMISLGARGAGRPQEPANNSGNPGGNAVNSTFTLTGFTTLTAGGGQGNGAGGTAAGGDLNITGQTGDDGSFWDIGTYGGPGGDSVLGRSNLNRRGTAPAVSGYGPGGASGAVEYTSPGNYTAYAGANGGDAVCIIEY